MTALTARSLSKFFGTLPKELVFATHNLGKWKEVSFLLEAYHIKVKKSADFELEPPLENGVSFAENAHLKAVFVARALNCLALADDSGLEVAALEGAPGVYSADWAETPTGQRDYKKAMAKIASLLEQKNAFLKGNNQACFTTVLCLAIPSGEHIFFEGKVEGTIVWPMRGDYGFGYDAIFQPLGYNKTFAEMTEEEKLYGARAKALSAPFLSHRAQAFQKLLAFFLGHDNATTA